MLIAHLKTSRRRQALLPGLQIAALGVLLNCGCGSGVVHTVPISRSDLPPGEALIQTVPLQHAFYWVDESGRLNVTLSATRASVWGPVLSSEWALSLVLDRMPAGRERLYQLTTRDLRVFHIRGAERRRARSFSGVAVIESPRHGRLRGRFHATVRYQVFSALAGWSPPHRGVLAVMTGSFEAVEGAKRGQGILAATEGDGFERPSAGTRPSPDGGSD